MRHSKTLRSQLTSFVVVAIFGAVGIVALGSLNREIASFSAAKTLELKQQAAIIATAVGEHVGAGDRRGALETLRAIKDLPGLDYVVIVDADGRKFAELGQAVFAGDRVRKADDLVKNRLQILRTRTVVATAPIVDRGRVIGAIDVYADTSSLAHNLLAVIWDSLVAAVLAAAVGTLVALRLQEAVTRPIFALAGVMSAVRETGDFGVRAKKERDDEVGALVESFNDMLNQVQERDARLLAHQQNLRKTVERRTRELERAKEIAERASLAKTEFLATMSHEIRTPMNGMLVMAELLSKADLGPRHKRYADVIARSGQGLLAIINDVLDLSKIEAGKLELERIPLAPSAIINDAIGLFWERAASKGVDLAAYVEPTVPELVAGDPVRLNQIISNLLNNALKFTAKGSVVVTARRAALSGGQCRVEFAVADTGVGIAKTKQAEIFQAFSQADQTTSRRFGGTGLGLAICRRLVEAMGGDIGVTSAEGKGARFHFTIPVEIIEPARPIPETSGGKRAIIAVNGEATAKSLERYLREAGIASQIVEPGAPPAQLAYTDMIFASPALLDAYHRAAGDDGSWVPVRICVSELGDAASDRLIEAGVAEDLLIRPMSRRDVAEQIERIAHGTLRRREAGHGVAVRELDLPMFRGRRILAADDSAVNREVVQEALTRLGVEPVVVSSGEAALAAAAVERFDLILMDCSMPDMDGYAATRAIRDVEETNGRTPTPVIALTAHVATEDDKWRAAGMNYYLTKPYTMHALAAAIAAFLHPTDAYVETSAAGRDARSAPLRDAPAFDGPAFDGEVLAELAKMGGHDLVVRAMSLFEEHSRAAMARLVAATKSSDADEIRSAAHALKSMSANVGAKALAAACADLETLMRGGNDAEAATRGVSTIRTRLSAALRAAPAVKAKPAFRAA